MALDVTQAPTTIPGEASADRKTVWWADDAVCLIDQTRLPFETEVVYCTTVDEVAHAIRSMQVRGAPAIGVTAAYGLALTARQHPALCISDLQAALVQAASPCQHDRHILLSQEGRAGHGVGKPVAKRADELADGLVFLGWQLGLEPPS